MGGRRRRRKGREEEAEAKLPLVVAAADGRDAVANLWMSSTANWCGQCPNWASELENFGSVLRRWCWESASVCKLSKSYTILKGSWHGAGESLTLDSAQAYHMLFSGVSFWLTISVAI